MDIFSRSVIELIISFVIFFVLTFIGIFIVGKLKNSNNRFLNPKEFLPEDELHSLRQVYYLILMACCFINVLYYLVGNDFLYFAIFDIALSLYVAITLDKSDLKNKILLFLLVPFDSFSFILFGTNIFPVIYVIHILVFIYLIKLYFDKFMEYTSSNGLGITIVLVFSIVFVSFLITQVVEGVNPLDSLVMVSNAFTSNGYSVLGSSILGKINSIFLVWGGYIISGAATATLTATILMRHFNKRFKELEKLIDEEYDDNG